MDKDRLLEKLSNYERAQMRLYEATLINEEEPIIYDGVIQRFKFTFELSWKVMKVFLAYMGVTEPSSPRTTIKEAFAYGLIEDGETWIDMLIDRNKTSHLYDEAESKRIYDKIKCSYQPLLSRLYERLKEEINNLE
ncbi:nucleotidyltransferase substrate binding protein [Shouchella lonarensis]|uniref:Nucleotidyltransferase substrate binding protein, HI0074 family n=1 Tax=Shouchella lonarensis TaxID=1464122 RepID=A0A1G6JNP5_9BACI|nr:nucleotidyltransferase substrate binding protein [Shouchella lonarensis]SDC20281.1 nucleotidyltransferase substrate binding protein, HI0074 family [Shouchella lonarensis]